MRKIRLVTPFFFAMMLGGFFLYRFYGFCYIEKREFKKAGKEFIKLYEKSIYKKKVDSINDNKCRELRKEAKKTKEDLRKKHLSSLAKIQGKELQEIQALYKKESLSFAIFMNKENLEKDVKKAEFETEIKQKEYENYCGNKLEEISKADIDKLIDTFKDNIGDIPELDVAGSGKRGDKDYLEIFDGVFIKKLPEDSLIKREKANDYIHKVFDLDKIKSAFYEKSGKELVDIVFATSKAGEGRGVLFACMEKKGIPIPFLIPEEMASDDDYSSWSDVAQDMKNFMNKL